MNTPAPNFFIQLSSFLQVMRACIKACMSSNDGQIPLLTPELTALEHLVYNVVKSRMSSKFGQIRP